MSHCQRGGATVGMVLLLLIIGLAMVNGLAEQLVRQLPALRLNREAVKEMSAILSLQAQSMRLPWVIMPESVQVQCQSVQGEGGKACLQRVKGGRWLLRVALDGSRPAPVLWRWVTFNNGRLQAQRAGWIDLCPAQAQRCY